jgi:hypothetical protein
MPISGTVIHRGKWTLPTHAGSELRMVVNKGPREIMYTHVTRLVGEAANYLGNFLVALAAAHVYVWQREASGKRPAAQLKNKGVS